MASVPSADNNNAVVDNQTNIDLNVGDKNPPPTTSTTTTNPANDVAQVPEQNAQQQPQSVVVRGDEPYVGQEFESEEAAHAFYAAYGTRMGFMTRMSSVSRKSGIIVRRTLVCNKEGYYNDKRPGQEKRKRPRTLTRVGCKANIVIRRLVTGIWVVKKIVKEHTHPLAERPNLFAAANSYMAPVPSNSPSEAFNKSDDKRVQELTIQLLREKKRSASYRKIIDLLVSHIKEHTEDVSKTVQTIGDKINQIESDGKNPKKKRR